METEESVNSIGEASDFKENPVGWNRRWGAELRASGKMLEDFHKKAEKVNRRFLDDRGDRDEGDDYRVNLFWSNTRTLASSLYANLPRVDVSRKFDDMEDDVARVAKLILQRLLDYDITENGKEYDTVLKQAVQDRLIPGLACARVFYEFEEEPVQVPAYLNPETGEEMAPAYEDTQITYEAAPCEYYYWKDVRWSWSRSWADLRWIAFRNYLTKDQCRERFGEDVCKQLKFTQRKVEGEDSKAGGNPDDKDLWHTTEVWEIWSKDHLKVFWWSDGANEILDEKDDPLGLEHFFPCPRWMFANCTTTFLMPKSDYEMAQDLYNSVDLLQRRITILTEAVKVVGVYDQSSEGIKRMLSEGVENDLIPVDNWAMFAEKGGIQGQIDWLPLDAVANAIIQLRDLRDESIMLLEKVTGMSDILSGTGTHPREGVGTQQMKAEFGSVHIQSLQGDIAQFATDLLETKAEVVCRHFSPATIAAMANVAHMLPEDQGLAEQAIQLLKDWKKASMRIKVRSESMARVDYTRMKNERSEYMMALSQFMQSAAPLIQLDRGTTPFLLQMLKWWMIGFKGSDEIEGVLDKTIELVVENVSKPQPEDNSEAEKVRAEMQKEQARLQGEVMKIQEKVKADLQVLKAKTMAKLMEVQAKSEADVAKEEAQAYFSEIETATEAAFESLLREQDAKLKEEESALRAKTQPSG